MRKALQNYSRWLVETLGLTLGGRIAFTAVAVVGGAGVIADAVFGGEHGDQTGGVLFVFVCVALGILVGLDGVYREARRLARRIAGRTL